MPSIDIHFLQKLHADYTHYPLFLETGTHYGQTIFACEPHFEKLYTIELDKSIFQNVSSQYKGDKISFLCGDSALVLKDVLPELNKPAIFFLDGHWSGGGTGKGQKDCPLVEEITDIYNLFQNEGIIIIDDYRLFGKGPRTRTCNEDWEDISKEKLITILGSRVQSVYHLDSQLSPIDRLVIHIKCPDTQPAL